MSDYTEIPLGIEQHNEQVVALDCFASPERIELILSQAQAEVDALQVQTDTIVALGNDDELREILCSIDTEAANALATLHAVCIDKENEGNNTAIREIFDLYQKADGMTFDEAVEKLAVFPLEEVMDLDPVAVFDIDIIRRLYEKKIERGQMQEVLGRPVEELYCFEIASHSIALSEDPVFSERKKKIFNINADALQVKIFSQKSLDDLVELYRQLEDVGNRQVQSELGKKAHDFCEKYHCGDVVKLSLYRGLQYNILRSRSVKELTSFEGVQEGWRMEVLCSKSLEELLIGLDEGCVSDSEMRKVLSRKCSQYDFRSAEANNFLDHWGRVKTFLSQEQSAHIYEKSSLTYRQIIDRLSGTEDEWIIFVMFRQCYIREEKLDQLHVSEVLRFVPTGKQSDALYCLPIRHLVGASELLDPDVLYKTLAIKWGKNSLYSKKENNVFHTLSVDLLLGAYKQILSGSNGDQNSRKFQREVLVAKSVDELERSIPGGATSELFWDIIIWKPIDTLRDEWPGIRPGIGMKQVFIRTCISKKVNVLSRLSSKDDHGESLSTDLAHSITVAEALSGKGGSNFYSILAKKPIAELGQAVHDGILTRGQMKQYMDDDVGRWVESIQLGYLDKNDLAESVLFSKCRYYNVVGVVTLPTIVAVCRQCDFPHSFLLELVKRLENIQQTITVLRDNIFTVDEKREMLECFSAETIASSGISLREASEYLSHGRLVRVAKQCMVADIMSVPAGTFTKDELLYIIKHRPLAEYMEDVSRLPFNQAEIATLFDQYEPMYIGQWVGNEVGRFLEIVKYIPQREKLIRVAQCIPFRISHQANIFSRDELVHVAMKRDFAEVDSFVDVLNPSEMAIYISQQNQAAVIKYFHDHPDALPMLPWRSVYNDLYKLQPIATNLAHDPVTNELSPLLGHLFKQKILSAESPIDGAYLLEYIKEFGVNNMPTIAEIAVRVRRGDFFDVINQNGALKTKIVEFFGKKYLEKKRTAAEVLNDIRKAKISIQGDILSGRINEQLQTELGIEILNAVRGKSQFDRHLSLVDIVKTTFDSQRKNPAEMSLPHEYEEGEYLVATKVKKEQSIDEVGQLEVKKQSIYARTAEYQHALSESVMRACAPDVSVGSLCESLHTEIVHSLTEYLDEIDKKLDITTHDKAIVSLQQTRQLLEGALQVMGQFVHDAKAGDGIPDVLAHNIDILVGIKKVGIVDKVIGQCIKLLSLRHMYEAAPEGVRENMIRIGDTTEVDAVIRLQASFVREYLHEHYLQGKQEVEHTGHQPLLKESVKRLRLLWQVKEHDLKQNPVIRAEEELYQLAQLGTEKGVQKPITFVPAKGILRVIAGDIGDACYTSKAQELAKGEYPDIIAVAMVKDRGKATENTVGSVLFIETKTDSGEPALIVRANNPRLHVFDVYSDESFIDAVLQYAKEMAKRRRIDVIGIPLDYAGGSSSNRGEVAQYYKKQFGSNQKIRLVDEPETNFNGYNIHDPNKDHPVVRVV